MLLVFVMIAFDFAIAERYVGMVEFVAQHQYPVHCCICALHPYSLYGIIFVEPFHHREEITMKLLRNLLILLLLLTMLPFAAAEEAVTYAPLEPWLRNRNPAPAPYRPNPDNFLPDNGGYIDDSLSITIETTFWTQDVQRVETQAEGVTRVLAIRVKLTDVTQFRTSLAEPYPSKQTASPISVLVRSKGALGINGDYFNYHSNGIIYRNGRQLRFDADSQRDLLIIDTQGDFHYLTPTTKTAWDEFIATGREPLHTFWFGPSLVNADGTAIAEFDNSVGNAPWDPAQRMAIGQVGPLEYLILCSEGPESRDFTGQGYSLAQLSKLCVAFGMDNAYNLDGGSSATVILKDQKINSQSNPKLRPLGDIIYFASLIPR